MAVIDVVMVVVGGGRLPVCKDLRTGREVKFDPPVYICKYRFPYGMASYRSVGIQSEDRALMPSRGIEYNVECTVYAVSYF